MTSGEARRREALTPRGHRVLDALIVWIHAETASSGSPRHRRRVARTPGVVKTDPLATPRPSSSAPPPPSTLGSTAGCSSAYLAELHDQDRASPIAATAVAAACFRDPASPATRVRPRNSTAPRFSRRPAEPTAPAVGAKRGRSASADLAAVLAHRPRRRGRARPRPSRPRVQASAARSLASSVQRSSLGHGGEPSSPDPLGFQLTH